MNKKEKALLWLKNFIRILDTQDTLVTAKPVQYLLQNKKEFVANSEYNVDTRTVFWHPDMEGRHKDTMDEAIEFLKDYGYFEKELEEKIKEIEQFEIGHYWDTSQAFLTKEGLDRHIAMNEHNLKEHRTYVVHAFRNPELKELIEAIRDLVE